MIEYKQRNNLNYFTVNNSDKEKVESLLKENNIDFDQTDDPYECVAKDFMPSNDNIQTVKQKIMERCKTDEDKQYVERSITSTVSMEMRDCIDRSTYNSNDYINYLFEDQCLRDIVGKEFVPFE